jgi:hypothetical protein
MIQVPPEFDLAGFVAELYQFALPFVSVAALCFAGLVILKILRRG